MRGFLLILLICSVTMSGLALLYMAATPFLAKRYSVTGRYYGWLIIVIGLIIPFRPQFKNPIVKVAVPDTANAVVLRPGTGIPVTVPDALTPSLTNISWWRVAAAVWLAGMAVFLCYHIVKHFRFLKLTAHWSENAADEQTLALLQTLKNQMGVSKNIDLKICDSIGSPMMTGFTSPRILLPRASFPQDELRFILKHELVHYKRKDLWYKCLVLTAAAIHWFNPIVHLMAKAIDLQCELSCDAEVIRNTGAGVRQRYSETILGVVRRRSKQKTALSTNFYGGKKGMKKRIFSIMDMGRKKAGAAVLCCTLVLTLGTGFAFAANPAGTETEPSHETAPFGYSFQPDPAIYSQYASYGITISNDGKTLLYNGQGIRLFVDEHSDTEAFFLDESGTLDLRVIRNASGKIIGIEGISRQKASEYRSAFFDGDTKSNVQVKETAQDIAGKNKFEQYSPHGITLSADGEALYHNGRRVRLFVDKASDGRFEAFWFDDAGEVNLSAVRNAAGQIASIQHMTEEQSREYQSAPEEYEQTALNGLEEKIEAKVKALYPER